MTVKKAIRILAWIQDNKTKTVKEFYEPEILSSKSELGVGLYRTLLQATETDIHNLQAVKEQLVSDCKHPKKMRDKDPDGKWYCMNCNQGL